jgi:hypothetical protein
MGRLTGRPMLRDIKTKKLEVDAILVDTYERFGRADELAEERRILYVRFGVLILTADSGFADPNSPQGCAVLDAFSISADDAPTAPEGCRCEAFFRAFLMS